MAKKEKDARLGIPDKSMIDAPEGARGEEELPVAAPVEEPEKKEPDPKELFKLERELRRYVRRGGGFREGIPEIDRKRAQSLMKKLGRATPAWDETIRP